MATSPDSSVGYLVPEPDWVAENAEGIFSDLIFDGVTLTVKKVMVLTSLSEELFQDAIRVPETIENALADSLAFGCIL